MSEQRIRGFAEIEAIHRDASGHIKSVERKTSPVTYREGPNGPEDIQEVKDGNSRE